MVHALSDPIIVLQARAPHPNAQTSWVQTVSCYWTAQRTHALKAEEARSSNSAVGDTLASGRSLGSTAL